MFAKAVVTLAIVGPALAQMINTPPSLIECQPASITFSGGTSPYILAAIPGGDVGAAAIENLESNLMSSPYTWTVNLASGSNITLKLTDATGSIGYSSSLVIQAGSSSDCLNSTANVGGVSMGSVTQTVTSSGMMNATSGAVAGGMSTASASSMSASSMSASSMSASSMSASSMSASAGAAASSSKMMSSGATTPAAAASSSAAAMSSASASSTAKSGALHNAIAAVPAIAAGLFGGLVAIV